jgi:NADPH2:quinone reductase
VLGIADVRFAPAELRRLTSYALAEVVAGRLEVVVGEVFGLERAAQAHAAVESRQLVGKVLLKS